MRTERRAGFYRVKRGAGYDEISHSNHDRRNRAAGRGPGDGRAAQIDLPFGPENYDCDLQLFAPVQIDLNDEPYHDDHGYLLQVRQSAVVVQR